jgi:serine/threonine-protein kinase
VHLDRLRCVAALPSDGGWRADLAVDRSVSPPRAVLVARVPPSVTGDALALSLLARGLDLVTRVQHPALRRVLGTGEVDGDLVLVEAWREGATVREVLDAGGALTPELTARVAVEVAGALQACQALPVAQGRPLSHGAVRAERILLAEDGAVLLCGMGRPFAEDASLEDDLRGLARVLFECLPPSGSDSPGPLAMVLDQVLIGEGFPTAAAFAEAVAAAVTPAAPSAVAARAEASQPEGTPAWLSRRRALAQALRAEDGAAADEVAERPAAAPGTVPGATVPEPPPPPLPPAGQERPAHTPPPLPAVQVSPAPVGLPSREERAVAADHFYEDRIGEPGAAATSAPSPGWSDHPRAPLLVGVVGALVGLAIGLLLGGR